jgi:hypothetical protein
MDISTLDNINVEGIPDANGDSIPDYMVPVTDTEEMYSLSQLFGQAEYKFTDDLSATFGLHSQYLALNGNVALEPRAAISWQYNPAQRISFAYGLHAQNIPSPVLFYEEQVDSLVFERTNIDLGFMKAHHFVLGYDRNFGPDWRMKVEAYYQHLFDVPVETVPSSYSMVNEGSGFVFQQRGSLVSEGTGDNLGLELTVEKFFSRGYYVLLTTSIFESTYMGSDEIRRSTAYNNNLVVNVLLGKEWKFGKNGQNAWTFDTKLTSAGGTPYTMIDLDATRENDGYTMFHEDQAYEQRYMPYFRWDVKLGVRLNSGKRNVSHRFFVDLRNVTNRENEFVERYNPNTDEINEVYQMGFFPDLMYRIQF